MADPVFEATDLGLDLIAARALEESFEHVLGIEHAQINPEQAVEIGELELIERAQRVGPVGLSQLLGDLAQRQAAVSQRLEAAKLCGGKALLQPLDGLGVGLCAGDLVFLGVDESLKSGVSYR